MIREYGEHDHICARLALYEAVAAIRLFTPAHTEHSIIVYSSFLFLSTVLLMHLYSENMHLCLSVYPDASISLCMHLCSSSFLHMLLLFRQVWREKYPLYNLPLLKNVSMYSI